MSEKKRIIGKKKRIIFISPKDLSPYSERILSLVVQNPGVSTYRLSKETMPVVNTGLTMRRLLILQKKGLVKFADLRDGHGRRKCLWFPTEKGREYE